MGAELQRRANRGMIAGDLVNYQLAYRLGVIDNDYYNQVVSNIAFKETVMLVNLQPKVRSALYSISIVAMPIFAYLSEQGVITPFVAGLIVVINSGVLLLARVNVTPEE